MTDAATRDQDPARAEVARYRAGEPTRGPLLWQAGVWETPAEALEALRSGAWQPVACSFCAGKGRLPWNDRLPTLQPDGGPCPLCLGTGLSWSKRHAELAAYAGEESLKRPRPLCRDCADEDGVCPTTGEACDPDDMQSWLSALSGWGTVPPVVAALGVVWAWLRRRWGKRIPPVTGRGMSTNERRACEQALDAVERWCYWPSEEHRLACESPDWAPPPPPVTQGVRAVRHSEARFASWAIRDAMLGGLPEDQAAQAARAAVSEWALAGLRGRS